MAEDWRVEGNHKMSNFEIVEWEGKPAKKFENGTIYQGGKVRYLPSHVAQAIKAQQRDIARLAAIDGMNEAIGKTSYYDSVKELIKRKTEMALTDTTRAGTEAMNAVLRHTGLGQERVTTVQGTIHHVPEPPRPSETFLRLLEEQQDATDGEIVEDE